MATRTARIKSHTRTSKNGKVHKVKAHGRKVSMAEMWASFRNNATVKKITWSSTAAVGFTGLMWTLSTAMNVMAAAIWAILLACMAVFAMLLMTKSQRKAKRKRFRQAAALSVERRLKLWTHHRVAQFKAPTMKKKTTRPAPAPAPARKNKATSDRPNSRSSRVQADGGITHESNEYATVGGRRKEAFAGSVLPNAPLGGHKE